MTKEELIVKAMELLVEAKEEKKTELGYLKKTNNYSETGRSWTVI